MMKINTQEFRRRLVSWIAMSALVLSVGCMGEGDPASTIDNGGQVNGDDNNLNNTGNNQVNDENNNEPPPPEDPEEYEFAEPAIIGHHVYVANETLNSVAIIDSRNLSVDTILTGVRPTRVVGPGPEGADDGARAMALNVGSNTVTAIDPDDHSMTNLPVLPGSNQIAMAPGGLHAVVWYDQDEVEPGQQPGDLSAVSVVSGDASYQIAVGFSVREVRFDEEGNRALIVTNDGVSVLDFDEIESDGFSPPIDLIPDSHDDERVRELTIDITSDGAYLVAHRAGGSFLLVTEIDAEENYAIELPAAPTGVALREDDDEVELFAVLRSEAAVLRATIPGGLQAAYEGQQIIPEPDPETGEIPDEDPWLEYEDFGYIDLPFSGPGSIALSADGEQAFLFTTIGDEKRGVLLDVEDEEASELYFEKTIRGVLVDERGDTFLVFHDRVEGPTEGLTPVDPEYVERKWGFTILDVQSQARRLILTEHDLDDAVLWSPPTDNAIAYMTFATPGPGAKEPAHRDVLRVDLGSFRKDSFRLASLPDGMGVIPEAEKIFVNQMHPQGRMTFIEVETNDRQTVTGYQLNAGIE